ncbi:MAG: hypothetical protein WA970_19380 [Gammaproteobacteria bacterium]
MDEGLSAERLAELCQHTIPRAGHRALLEGLSRLSPQHDFRWVLTRGGWYRLGGVVTESGARITENLDAWLQQLFRDCGETMGVFVERVAKAGYLVTRWLGKTHYFVAPTGPGSADFFQLEVEELQEVIARALIDPAAPPEDLDELMDPALPSAQPFEPLAAPHYVFRRVTDVSAFLAEMPRRPLQTPPIRRFISEWERSSAGRTGRFCDRWVLSLRNHKGVHGEAIFTATPACTYGGTIPRLHIPALARGPDLARLVQHFDHELGYPFAWYFCMIHSHHVPTSLGDSVYQDLRTGFDYLPERDQAVLAEWIRYPYCL